MDHLPGYGHLFSFYGLQFNCLFIYFEDYPYVVLETDISNTTIYLSLKYICYVTKLIFIKI